jgi:hypothetical protein
MHSSWWGEASQRRQHLSWAHVFMIPVYSEEYHKSVLAIFKRNRLSTGVSYGFEVTLGTNLIHVRIQQSSFICGGYVPRPPVDT